MRITERVVVYAVQDGYLVRTVVTGDHIYVHRCGRATFEAVAHAVAETPAVGNGTTMELIAIGERIPYTRVNVALEFLKDRGIVEVRHRRCYPATADPYLDAMVEFLAMEAHGRSV